jgi:hypothetical protein
MVSGTWRGRKATATRENRMKYISAQPYTEAERERDDLVKRKAQRVFHTRRKATPSGQNYNVSGTKSSKARDDRVLGEAKAS